MKIKSALKLFQQDFENEGVDGHTIVMTEEKQIHIVSGYAAEYERTGGNPTLEGVKISDFSIKDLKQYCLAREIYGE
jgi:hypothetical protein